MTVIELEDRWVDVQTNTPINRVLDEEAFYFGFQK
jgi:hypothetical protein